MEDEELFQFLSNSPIPEPMSEEIPDNEEIPVLEEEMLGDSEDPFILGFASVVENLFSEMFVKGVTRDMLDLLQKTLVEMVMVIKTAVVNDKTDKNEEARMNFYFSVFQEVLKHHSTAYKRKREMKTNPFFIEPVAAAFGSQLVNKTKNCKSVVVNEQVCLYKVPIKKTVEALFKSKAFKEAFFNQRHQCKPGIYSNFCCGSKFQQSGKTTRNTIVIQIYYDGVNLGDPLKSKCNKFRIGTVYFRVLNLPPHLQSLHQNIHLVALFNENDVKKTDNKYNSIWKLLAEEIKDAENAQFQIDGQQISIAVMQATADNLGFHQLSGALILLKYMYFIFIVLLFTGMTESFQTYFPCLHCFISKEEIKSMETGQFQKRNSENFYEAFESTDDFDPQFLSSSKGVRFVSELKQCPNLGIPEGLGVDPFHDLEEGVLKDLLRSTLDSFIEQGLMTESNIASRINSFNYETDSDHKIHDIRHLSGLQIRNLVFRFNFIFSDLRTILPDYFKTISNVVEIMKIVYSSKLNDGHLKKLAEKLKILKETWVRIYRKGGKPKMHNILCHYVDMIKFHGPLALLETTAFERNHRQIKRTIEKGPQYININKMCSEKYMYWWSRKWISTRDEFYKLETQKEKRTKIDIQNLVNFPSTINWSHSHTVANVATWIHTYREGLYVARGTFENFSFYKIEQIIIFNSEIYLKCRHLKTLYSSFYAAYKIIKEDKLLSIFHLNDLFSTQPFCHAKPIDENFKYIICKRNII